ncbi:phosphoribosyl-ATP pyrophosphohydrolase [Anaerobacillus arseniciselenatis]|uniref:Phosphoribosyl-ATP pyrophosphohydrolase n=1 Tax=Anaerobacillus arseniciselenatis TaxID=85682 RepID=A0A1S2LCQ2_9BACI|nr:nucleoside triphosphate pyrophosphohydrolase [Anaerobacillus arseniciselenatis]OIJ09315.1 phosphoribosyl-ATP pyrophosphohydrolase [Anaerobacillus arseniciselenatis]
MPTYNKLVRDRIPEIIEQAGKKYTSSTLNDEQYLKELKNKSFEELEEYTYAANDTEAIEELADVLEIIHALATCHGATFKELEEIRRQKAEKRGRFQEKIFLHEVEDD